MRLHALQHVEFEGLAYIGDWAIQNNISVTHTLFYQDQYLLPALNDFDWLVVLGGPMNVDEESIYPWLTAEKEFIRRAIDAGKIVIGICLGAQLIARVLGAKVQKNAYKEIGWFPVSWLQAADTFPAFKKFSEGFMAFHWHGDTFDIPPQCVRIAETDVCANQAFIHESGRVIGLQFHLEANVESVRALIKNCEHELVEDWYVQSKGEIRQQIHSVQDINLTMELLLDNLLAHFRPTSILIKYMHVFKHWASRCLRLRT